MQNIEDKIREQVKQLINVADPLIINPLPLTPAAEALAFVRAEMWKKSVNSVPYDARVYIMDETIDENGNTYLTKRIVVQDGYCDVLFYLNSYVIAQTVVAHSWVPSLPDPEEPVGEATPNEAVLDEDATPVV